MIANPSMTSSSNECEELLRCLRGLVRHLSLLVRGGEPSPSSPLKPSSARFCFSWLSWCALSLRLVRFRGLLGSVSISTSNGALPTHKSPHTHLQALSLLFQFGLHKYSHRFSTIQQNISTSKTPMRSTIVQMAEHTIWPHYAQPSRISSRAQPAKCSALLIFQLLKLQWVRKPAYWKYSSNITFYTASLTWKRATWTEIFSFRIRVVLAKYALFVRESVTRTDSTWSNEPCCVAYRHDASSQHFVQVGTSGGGGTPDQLESAFA